MPNYRDGLTGYEGDPLELAAPMETLIIAILEHDARPDRPEKPIVPLDVAEMMKLGTIELQRQGWIEGSYRHALRDGIRTMGRIAHAIGGHEALEKLDEIVSESVERKGFSATRASVIIDHSFDGIGTWVA